MTKQLITIATAIIGLSATFSKDILGGVSSKPVLLAWTWGVYILSVCLGILTLMALTGNLDPIQPKDPHATPVPPNLTITSSNVRIFSIAQIIVFVVALIMTCVFAYVSITKK